MNVSIKRCAHGLIAGVFSLSVLSAMAEDVAEGTVITAANLAEMKDKTFEGKTIGSMLTEKIEWRIREQGLRIPLQHSKKIDMDPSWIAASNSNRGSAKINPQNRQVDGWKGGAPFPDIDMSDPQAAEKVVWNWYYGNPRGDVMNVPHVAYVMVDGGSGIERVQNWKFVRYTMKGRLTGDNIEGDGSELSRTLFFATAPRDIRGLGTYTVRSDNEKLEDVWAYIRAVRRVRRLSGGAWMDPIGGTDQLQDDIEVFNANPAWYSGYKLLGKRHILIGANGESPAWNRNAKTQAEEYPVLDLENAPYWNFSNDKYEPREVYVIEATPPAEHPYSKKVLYVDTQYPRIHMADIYDRKGEYWKMLQFHSHPGVGEDGFKDIRTTAGVTIDFQRNHATVFFPDTSTWSTNTPGMKADNVSQRELQRGGN